jgi:predicted MPP superfamily phosphohydrolase
MRITSYSLKTEKLNKSLRIALVADLHNREPEEMIEVTREIKPALILIAGDLTESLDGTENEKCERGLNALQALTGIAPVFYAPGNHEIGASHRRLGHFRVNADTVRISKENLSRITGCGACFLDNAHTHWQDITIGGLSSGLLNPDARPNLEIMQDFFAQTGYKILICHHPEYYAKYLREKDVDLVVSGHAHGGQWRLLGRGLFAPDQGIFPKYTSGVHEGRLVISRGTANTGGIIPRLFNPREVVCIQIN